MNVENLKRVPREAETRVETIEFSQFIEVGGVRELRKFCREVFWTKRFEGRLNLVHKGVFIQKLAERHFSSREEVVEEMNTLLKATASSLKLGPDSKLDLEVEIIEVETPGHHGPDAQTENKTGFFPYVDFQEHIPDSWSIETKNPSYEPDNTEPEFRYIPLEGKILSEDVVLSYLDSTTEPVTTGSKQEVLCQFHLNLRS